jgi:diguanylate cyclase (GGDEF)-like protein
VSIDKGRLTMPTQFTVFFQRRFWPGTIRMRLFLLVAMAALMLVGVRMLNLRSEAAHVIEKARTQAVDLARSGVNSGLDVIDDARMTLDILSHVTELTSGTGQACNALITDIQQSRAWATGLFVLDTSGTVICSSAAENLGLNIADRQYVRSAISTRKFVASDFIVGRKSGIPQLAGAMPVFDAQGNLRRVLIATISTKWFTKLANDMAATKPNSSVTLIDGNGIILAEAPQSGAEPGKAMLGDDMRAGLLSMKIANFDALGSDGKERIFGVSSLPHSQAVLMIGLSRADVEADLVRARHQAVAELAILCFLMGAAMWAFGAVTLERPIRALLGHARHVGHGRLDARLQSGSWPRELALLARTMNVMAGRLERRNVQLQAAQKKLRQQALTDPLTGLANRRAFDEKYAALWQEAHATGTPLAVAIVDADYFKRYNDTYGHIAGDAVLQGFGHILREEAARATGFAVRLGGEEFALVLPRHDEADGLEVADRVCAAVRALGIAHAGSPTGHVTVSIGVAGLVPATAPVDQMLMQSADAALYAAKSVGRNHALGNSRLGQLVPDQGRAKWLQRAG